jgi:hypothetical protein
MKVNVELDLKWYHFRQNNSGGYFIDNDDVGEDVFIQASSVEDVKRKAEEVFSGYREYCDCCGGRWSDDWIDETDGFDAPTKYSEAVVGNCCTWGGKTIYYHYDGRKEIF